MAETFRVRDRNTEQERGAIWGEDLSEADAHKLKEQVVGAGKSRTARVEPMSADPDVIGEPTTRLQNAPGIGYKVDPVPEKATAPQGKPWNGYIVDPVAAAKPAPAPIRPVNPPLARRPLAKSMSMPTLQNPLVHGQPHGKPLPAPNDPVLAAARAAALAAGGQAAQVAQERRDKLEIVAQGDLEHDPSIARACFPGTLTREQAQAKLDEDVANRCVVVEVRKAQIPANGATKSELEDATEVLFRIVAPDLPDFDEHDLDADADPNVDIEDLGIAEPGDAGGNAP